MYTLYVKINDFITLYGETNSINELEMMIQEIIEIYGNCIGFNGFKLIKNY